ncbi:hypothetical protein N7467_006887 [Penicillium canescens]|nr:hypothetical protein N7467_006887 [Penicillium canescens]
METINVDVLVCGGGISGIACAAFATEAGAKTLVAEKQTEIGCSSNYSAGIFWGPQTYDKLRYWVPAGDVTLQKAWMKDYLPAVQWMRDNGVPTAKRFNGIMTIGIGFPIKISHLHDPHQNRIRSSKANALFTNTSPGVPGSTAIGAITSKLVVLATGGFQGSPDITSKYLGQGGDNIFVRSNRGSVGDGLNMAIESGTGTSRGMNTYYGHLLPAPFGAEDVDPKDYLPLAQYQSKHCLLINEAGRQSADETTGDEIINQYLAKQERRRGFILFNEETRLRHYVGELFPNAGNVDRLQKARDHGCNVGKASTLNELVKILHQWGVDGKGPFYSIKLQPSYYHLHLRRDAIDSQGHALTPDNSIIPGLLVAGVDAGGFSNLGYAGGLALAFVTGFWAAQEAAKQLGLPVPRLPPADSRDGEDKPVQGHL